MPDRCATGSRRCSWHSANPVPHPTNRGTAQARNTPVRSGSCGAVTTIYRFKRISSRPMTATLTRPTSRYSWVPAAAGWTVGIIATLSLIASVSPGIRWIIKEPREFVNDYIFNFPDTSFAWAFVLALLAAALAARKRIAWWILVGYMVASIAWNVIGLVTSPRSVMDDIGEVIGLVVHFAAIVFLVLARKQFW